MKTVFKVLAKTVITAAVGYGIREGIKYYQTNKSR